MNCYNCGALLSEHEFCTSCGADVSTYKKLMSISNRFYNDGLAKAQVRDLTGAVNSLRQCLKFNKNNVQARNLLGLVYFEMGEVVAALSEWVISNNLQPKKNVAASYIEMVQSNPSKLESINQTIKKYNQALLYCNQDSRDLAVIQLKSVLNLNPKFVRAHLLLALLYIDSEDWKKADQELRRCEKIDIGNTQTKHYRKEVEMMLHPEETEHNRKGPRRNREKDDVVRYTSGNELVIQPKDVKEPKAFSLSSVAYLLIGLAIGVAAAIFLVLPARIQNARTDVSEQLKTVSEQLSAKSATIEELNQKVTSMEAENKSLHEELDQYVGTDGTLQTMDNMMAAINSYLQNPEETEEVAAYLESIRNDIDLEQASETFRSIYNTLLAAVGPTVGEGYYADGLDALKKEMYPDAIANLEKAYLYDPANEEILYNLANAYYKSGDIERAGEHFQKIVNDFPDTERAVKSQQYLDEIIAAQ